MANPLAIRSLQDEQMDAAGLDQVTYRRVLTDLAKVNRLTGSSRPTLGFLKRAAGGASQLRVLDVGFGDGDMLRSISGWATQHGIVADLIGIDLNPKSAAIAAAATPPGITIDWRAGDYADLAGQHWDCVISSFVAHHMTRAQLVAFVRFMEAESARGWFVNDLHRHRFAHAGFPLLARIMRWHRIVREDGALSIARSYRPAEWLPILAEAEVNDAHVFRAFPFRLCVERLR